MHRLLAIGLAWLLAFVLSSAHADYIRKPVSATAGGTGITGPGPTALTDASPIVVSAPAPYGSLYTVSLTTAVGATRVVGNPASLAAGMFLQFVFIEDGSGGEGVTWGTDYSFMGSSVISTVASAVSTVWCVADTTSTLRCVSSNAVTNAVPTQQRFTTGTSATYTTPAGARLLQVTACGGGGGGGWAGGSAGTDATDGGATTFNSITANGGTHGAGTTTTTPVTPGAGGTSGSGSATWRVSGTAGSVGVGAQIAIGPTGGYSNQLPFGLGGQGASALSTSRATGGSGGGGECFWLRITSPATSYVYTVGAAGAASVGAGTDASSGTAGQAGILIVDEFY